MITYSSLDQGGLSRSLGPSHLHRCDVAGICGTPAPACHSVQLYGRRREENFVDRCGHRDVGQEEWYKIRG